ncbi:hypothetical protein CgunFtcFv8_026457 [Champsocephalus gunnari]|uniref:Uncharacterized protein n=2 Tax=Channichthyidae TaxID=30806 RepID=A0AAN8HVD3_CHAGU|nr:hypothetical protein CgunFtcFv8_026457 [Champsocephalus gunnari]
MDHRGPPRNDSGRHSQTSKDREDYRYPQQDREQSRTPAPLPRERDRHWAQDPRYRAQFSSPPARAEPHPHNNQQYPYGYTLPEHQRAQSR